MLSQMPNTTTTMIGAIIPEEELVDQKDWVSEANEAVAALPAGSALLIVVRGPNLGGRFLLQPERVTAGRAPSADIFLDDVTVSRKHVEFQYLNGSWNIRDMGALNGTYLNRELIDQAVLKAGDQVQIGKYRMVFYPSPQEG